MRLWLGKVDICGRGDLAAVEIATVIAVAAVPVAAAVVAPTAPPVATPPSIVVVGTRHRGDRCAVGVARTRNLVLASQVRRTRNGGQLQGAAPHGRIDQRLSCGHAKICASDARAQYAAGRCVGVPPSRLGIDLSDFSSFLRGRLSDRVGLGRIGHRRHVGGLCGVEARIVSGPRCARARRQRTGCRCERVGFVLVFG